MAFIAALGVFVLPLGLALIDGDPGQLIPSHQIAWIYLAGAIVFAGSVLLGRRLALRSRVVGVVVGLSVAWILTSWLVYWLFKDEMDNDGVASSVWQDWRATAMVTLVLGVFAWALLGALMVARPPKAWRRSSP